MSFDSIVRPLGVPPADTIELPAGRGPTMGDFCDTLSHLEQTLVVSPAESPLFVYALPQNVHVSYVASQPRPTAGYPGFHAPTAAQLARVDDCFGRFVRFLKSVDRFDNSLIVVTADHGDSLGEDGRWGHAYAGFPEIFRIPLIVHLPADMPGWQTDPSRVSFSTDIAPTIYTLLGGRADARGRLFGASLFWRDEDDSERRREGYLLMSSYGPVYGLLTSNGSRLYVVDAINARDYAFDLAGGRSRRVNVTAAERSLNQQRITEQLVELSTFYRYDPQR